MSPAPSLSVVADSDRGPALKPEAVAERIGRLQAEVRALAHGEGQALHAALLALHAKAAAIHAGGDAYPAGVRSVARDVLLACESSGQTLAAILGRS